MCARTTCSQCGKPTWMGCGRHIEMVLRGVPKENRCKCAETATRRSDGIETRGEQPAQDPRATKRWYQR